MTTQNFSSSLRDLNLAAYCLRQDGTPTSERALILLERALEGFKPFVVGSVNEQEKNPGSPFTAVLAELSKIDIRKNGTQAGAVVRIESALNNANLLNSEKMRTAHDLAAAIPVITKGRNIGKTSLKRLKIALKAFGIEA